MINNLENGYKISARNEKKVKQISHLFYVDDLKLFASNKEENIRKVDMVKRFSTDICMEFGLDKCAFLTLRKGRRINSENIIIDHTTIKQLDQEKTYKYLGIEESEKVEHRMMKDRISKEYLKRVKLILRTELSARNKIEAIKSLAISVFMYSIGIIDWFQEDLNQLDVKTRKMLNAHRMIYKNQILSRMYVDRSEGGMGLIEMDNIYKREICGLGQYLEGSTSKYLEWILHHEQNKPATTSLTKKKRDFLEMYNISTEEEPGWGKKPARAKISFVKEKFENGRKQRHINQLRQQVMGREFRKNARRGICG